MKVPEKESNAPFIIHINLLVIKLQPFVFTFDQCNVMTHLEPRANVNDNSIKGVKFRFIVAVSVDLRKRSGFHEERAGSELHSEPVFPSQKQLGH